MDEDDRICLLLGPGPSSLLSLDRARDGGHEFEASAAGSSTNGNKLSPGLADRDSRGQGISPQGPRSSCDKHNVLLPLRLSLSLRHTSREETIGGFVGAGIVAATGARGSDC
jgi:hypothetical protein